MRQIKTDHIIKEVYKLLTNGLRCIYRHFKIMSWPYSQLFFQIYVWFIPQKNTVFDSRHVDDDDVNVQNKFIKYAWVLLIYHMRVYGVTNHVMCQFVFF